MNEERLSLSREHFPSSKLAKNGLRDRQNGSLKIPTIINGNKYVYRVKMKKHFISPMTLTSLYYT